MEQELETKLAELKAVTDEGTRMIMELVIYVKTQLVRDTLAFGIERAASLMEARLRNSGISQEMIQGLIIMAIES